MQPFNTGDYPGYASPATGHQFQNAIHQQQDDHRPAQGPTDPALMNPQGANNSGPCPEPTPETITIPLQTWKGARAETGKLKKERDALRMELAGLRNELYAARQVQKQLRGERDEAQHMVESLKAQAECLKGTQDRLRRERNEWRLKHMPIEPPVQQPRQKRLDPSGDLVGPPDGGVFDDIDICSWPGPNNVPTQGSVNLSRLKKFQPPARDSQTVEDLLAEWLSTPGMEYSVDDWKSYYNEDPWSPSNPGLH